MMKKILIAVMLFTFAAPAYAGSEDVNCLAQNLYHEARGEDASAIVAVGNVVKNRVYSKQFPNDVCSVIKQGGERRNRCQFSWWCDGRSDKIKDEVAWEIMLWLAEKMLDGTIADNTNGALFYHTQNVNPYWNVNMSTKMQLGAHIFY